jgi:cellobiose phosphorylase
MYPYLTGSASWYLLTFVTEVYGFRGKNGDLSLKPKLVAAQFDQNGNTCLKTMFANKIIELRYHNPQLLEYGSYQIDTILLNEKLVSFAHDKYGAILSRETISKQDSPIIQLDVYMKKI